MSDDEFGVDPFEGPGPTLLDEQGDPLVEPQRPISEGPKQRFECELCGKDYSTGAGLKRHQENAHGAKTPTTRRKAATGSLESRIREACLGTAAVVGIANPMIYVGVEATVDEFAASWANVAAVSPSAKKYIEAVLVGGVWIPAFMSTVVMLVTCAALSGALPPPLYPVGAFCISKNLAFFQAKGITFNAQPTPVVVSANGTATVDGPEST